MLEIPRRAEPAAKPQGVKAGIRIPFHFFYQYMWHNIGKLASPSILFLGFKTITQYGR